MADIKTFDSEKDFTRLEYLKRILIIIALVIVGHFIYYLRYSHRNDPSSSIWTVSILIGACVAFSWILKSRIITRIQLNITDKKFIVSFFTLFRKNRTLEVAFDYLTYSFDKTPRQGHAKKWTLLVFENKKKVFSIETDDDGFSQEILEDIVAELKNIK